MLESFFRPCPGVFMQQLQTSVSQPYAVADTPVVGSAALSGSDGARTRACAHSTMSGCAPTPSATPSPAHHPASRLNHTSPCIRTRPYITLHPTQTINLCARTKLDITPGPPQNLYHHAPGPNRISPSDQTTDHPAAGSNHVSPFT